MDRLVYVYKSRRKLRTFLYVPEKDVFSHIPAALMDAFGAPEFVMVFALKKERKLQTKSSIVLSMKRAISCALIWKVKRRTCSTKSVNVLAYRL